MMGQLRIVKEEAKTAKVLNVKINTEKKERVSRTGP